MNNEIKYSCDNCLRNSGTGCKSPSICICGSNYFPADDPNISIITIKEAARRIREHNRIHSARERQAVLITTALDMAANLLEEYDRGNIQPMKRGRWIITDDVEHFIAVCSECGRTEDSRFIKDMPYCHCGARMDGDSE